MIGRSRVVALLAIGLCAAVSIIASPDHPADRKEAVPDSTVVAAPPWAEAPAVETITDVNLLTTISPIASTLQVVQVAISARASVDSIVAQEIQSAERSLAELIDSAIAEHQNRRARLRQQPTCKPPSVEHFLRDTLPRFSSASEHVLRSQRSPSGVSIASG